MASFDLYLDTGATAGAGLELVTGVNSNAQAPVPGLIQGDTPFWRIFLLARTSSWPSGIPYTIINNAGLSLQVAIGTRVANSTTYYTQQFTWPPDAANQYFSAQLPLNTADITALIGGNPSAQAWLEIKYLSGGLPTTVLDRQVTLQAAVIKPGALVIPPGASALTAEDANASFLKKSNNGFVLKNDNTGKQVFCYLGDDGAVHWDPMN